MADEPRSGALDFELGRLHGRVAAVEARADQLAICLHSIEDKLDTVLVSLATAAGGSAQLSSTARLGFAIITILTSIGGLTLAALHFIAPRAGG